MVDYVAAMHARAQLATAGQLPTLPEASKLAADKSYLEAADRLAEGLFKVVKSSEKSPDPHHRRVFQLWQEGEGKD